MVQKSHNVRIMRFIIGTQWYWLPGGYSNPALASVRITRCRWMVVVGQHRLLLLLLGKNINHSVGFNNIRLRRQQEQNPFVLVITFCLTLSRR